MEGTATAATDEAVGWAHGLEALVAPRFRRIESRRRAAADLNGLLAPIERKNGWRLAESADGRTPDGVQVFLLRMRREADQVRAPCAPAPSRIRATPMPCQPARPDTDRPCPLSARALGQGCGPARGGRGAGGGRLRHRAAAGASDAGPRLRGGPCRAGG